ncbi:hypothetical protein JI739_00495 [Ramlibacter sp. AW1]|uniref:Uncharacterized protein n=1 Tax=Ramlibacter aurantiacus TaxID=2801330 RepID=A0A936ZD97_9BURK|nr:hypothetical protein [Ramlibacter aurantiacus]MBL0418812.1 hypothetical protein [Ramlibacter aurantiacus]
MDAARGTHAIHTHVGSSPPPQSTSAKPIEPNAIRHQQTTSTLGQASPGQAGKKPAMDTLHDLAQLGFDRTTIKSATEDQKWSYVRSRALQGALAGAMAGALPGASAGTLVMGLGTLPGAAIGGVVGGVIGAVTAARVAWREAFR